MTAKLNLLAVQNADVLRAIQDDADDQIRTNADLARLLGRDGSNMAKTVKALITAGLLTDQPLHHGLTEDGRAQLAMIGRAEHGRDKRRVRGFWPLDKIRPNPANRPIDPAGIPGLADTVEDEGVLQPALLTPPDASGVRMILAGERRWRALCHLRAEGRADDKVEQGLPFIEREADEATALVITLIENGQREDLSPWEDAQQLKALQDATSWSAREIAKKTGRSPADSDTGVRDVQQKIKVAREASPEAIAEYDRTGSWDQLRDSVTKPRLTPAAANPPPTGVEAGAAEPTQRPDHAQHGGGGLTAHRLRTMKPPTASPRWNPPTPSGTPNGHRARRCCGSRSAGTRTTPGRSPRATTTSRVRARAMACSSSAPAGVRWPAAMTHSWTPSMNWRTELRERRTARRASNG